MKMYSRFDTTVEAQSKIVLEVALEIVNQIKRSTTEMLGEQLLQVPSKRSHIFTSLPQRGDILFVYAIRRKQHC